MQKKAGIHREDIKAAIRKKGMSLEQLSLMNGLCRSAVTVALHRPYYYAEQVIARFLNIPAPTIWPERYDKEGNPLHRNARSHRYTPHKGGSASLKVAA